MIPQKVIDDIHQKFAEHELASLVELCIDDNEIIAYFNKKSNEPFTTIKLIEIRFELYYTEDIDQLDFDIPIRTVLLRGNECNISFMARYGFVYYACGKYDATDDAPFSEILLFHISTFYNTVMFVDRISQLFDSELFEIEARNENTLSCEKALIYTHPYDFFRIQYLDGTGTYHFNYNLMKDGELFNVEAVNSEIKRVLLCSP